MTLTNKGGEEKVIDRPNLEEIAKISTVASKLDETRLLLLKSNADVLLAQQEMEKAEQNKEKEGA